MSDYGVAVILFFGFLLFVLVAVTLALKFAWWVAKGVAHGSATLGWSLMRGWKPPRP